MLKLLIASVVGLLLIIAVVLAKVLRRGGDKSESVKLGPIEKEKQKYLDKIVEHSKTLRNADRSKTPQQQLERDIQTIAQYVLSHITVRLLNGRNEPDKSKLFYSITNSRHKYKSLLNEFNVPGAYRENMMAKVSGVLLKVVGLKEEDIAIENPQSMTIEEQLEYVNEWAQLETTLALVTVSGLDPPEWKRDAIEIIEAKYWSNLMQLPIFSQQS